MRHTSLLTLCLFIFLSMPVLQGCTGLGIAAGVGATAGVAAAKEGGFKNAVRDEAIRFQILDYYFKQDVKIFSKVGLTVQDGHVLLTGIVENPDHRVEAVRLAWQAKNVERVINEIQVKEERSWTSFARDAWITTQLRGRITFDKYIQSINYSIDTVEGVVYLMGIGQDTAEIARVVDHARNVAYVTQVVSYVRVRGQTPENLKTPALGGDIVDDKVEIMKTSTDDKIFNDTGYTVFGQPILRQPDYDEYNN